MAEDTTEIDLNPYGTSTTKRPTSPGIENQLFEPNRIHGGDNFVRPVDYMGNDDTVTYWATMGRGTDVFEQDVSEDELRRYLISNDMMRPLHSVQVRRHEETPISVALTTVPEESANVNEYSGRYSVMPKSCVTWDRDFLLEQGVPEENVNEVLELKDENEGISRERYEGLIDKDLARELAREILPITQQTKYYQKNTLANGLRFIDTNRGRNPLLDEVLDIREDLWRAQAPRTVEAYDRVEREGEEFEDELTVDRDALDTTDLTELPFGESETKRLTVEPVEDVLFDKKELLDDGFFRPIDYMGSDGSIVQAARVSYGDGTKTKRRDKGLINYLWRHRHTTPFEMVEIAAHKRMPGFTWRQDIRHRTVDKTGILEEYPMVGEGFVPPKDEIRFQSTENRQGRGELMEDEAREDIRDELQGHHDFQDGIVADMEELGVPPSLAGTQRGIGFHTEACTTSDAKNWLHYLGLRLDSHAQKEIRVYADATADVVKKAVPWTWEAFENYSLGATRLNADEQEALGHMMEGREFDEALDEAGMMYEKDGEKKRGRVAREFRGKLEDMGIDDRFKGVDS